MHNALIIKPQATSIGGAPNEKRRKRWRTKTAKSPNVQHTQNAPLARKEITPLSGAGKELGHSYVPKGHDPKIKLMKPPGMRNRPKSQITLKLHLHANQTHVKPYKKTNFVTTPSIQPDVSATTCHI